MPGTGKDSRRGRFQPTAGPRGGAAIHLILILGMAFSAGRPAEVLAAAIPIGREKQLLWDDYLIETLHHTGFVLNQAPKAPNNPVIRQDRPWEGNLIRVATVFYDEDQGRFRLWYTSETRETFSRHDRWERSGQIVLLRHLQGRIPVDRNPTSAGWTSTDRPGTTSWTAGAGRDSRVGSSAMPTIPILPAGTRGWS